jgi:hypothetical protein
MQTNHFILFYCFYCLNFIYLFNLLFSSYLFNIQFSDHSTSNPQQEDEIWTQGGIQGLVDRADQDHQTSSQLLDSLYQVSDSTVQGTS